jgi:ureidoacrylate peracid hydrolase
MKAALLVIDVQRIYTDPESEMYCSDARGTVRRINTLIERYGAERRPIFFVRHVHKGDGSDLGRMFDFSGEAARDFNFREGTPEVEYDAQVIRPGSASELVKNRYSAFAGTDLHDRLQAAKVNRVAVCGFMTNFCCESTARSAHDLDYFVDFVIDATGTPGTDNFDETKTRQVVGEHLAAGFGQVVSTRSHLGRRWPQSR